MKDMSLFAIAQQYSSLFSNRSKGKEQNNRYSINLFNCKYKYESIVREREKDIVLCQKELE